MPYDYRILPEEQVVVVRFYGTFTASAGIEWTRDYFADPDFCPEQRHLVDWEHVSTFDADYASVSALVRNSQPGYSVVPKGLLCVMHAPQDLNFGMARMYQQVADTVLPLQIEVTRSETEAVERAGIPDKTLEGVLPLRRA